MRIGRACNRDACLVGQMTRPTSRGAHRRRWIMLGVQLLA